MSKTATTASKDRVRPTRTYASSERGVRTKKDESRENSIILADQDQAAAGVAEGRWPLRPQCFYRPL